MANQTLQSTNFTINFDPVALPKSPTRASALFSVIESEFTDLCDWFGVTSGFGTGNRVNVNFVGSLSSGGANNFGYKGDGTTTINLISRETDPSDTNAASIVRMSFVAEFVEVLMSYRNTLGPETWNAGYSHGEGLSLMCAQLRFKGGYYASYPGGWVNSWVQLVDRNTAGRDWISNVKKTDGDAESYGCSLLFLFYLKSQLGYSMQDIVQKAGNTLELTYKNLTGKTGAMAAFSAFIDPYFPPGNTPALASDNPFPLLGAGQREVDIEPSTAAYGGVYTVRSGADDVSPGLLCPKKHYRFDILRTPQVLTCVATGKGFAQPVYRWRVNGVDVPNSGAINPMSTVTIDTPEVAGLVTTKTVPVTISCTVTPATFSSTLVMTFGGAVEHIDLVIEAFAHEKYASVEETSDIDWMTVDNEKIQWEPQYYIDRDACAKRWRDLVHRYVRYDPFFDILHTLPDPAPDYARVFRQLEQLSSAVMRLHEQQPEEARQIEINIEQAIGVNATLLHDIGRLGRMTRNQEQPQQRI
jgi:hypothetical protein